MGLDWVCFDVVAVNSIKNNNITITSIWRDRKTACLVGIYITVQVGDWHVDVVAALVVGQLW